MIFLTLKQRFTTLLIRRNFLLFLNQLLIHRYLKKTTKFPKSVDIQVYHYLKAVR